MTRQVLERLTRSMERLNEFEDTNAPAVIKKAELLLMKELCDKLLTEVEGE